MKTAALALCALSLGGCATLTSPPEVVYQSLSAVDTLQTLEIAREPDRFYERESGWLIGRHPSKTAVIALGVGRAVVHAAVTDYLAEHDHPVAACVWQAVTIGYETNIVGSNYHFGLKFGF